MHITTTTVIENRLSTFMLHTAAVTLFAAAAAIGLQAQSAASGHASPPPDLKAALAIPLNLDLSATNASTSSSTTSDAVAAERFNLSAGDASQPPPRRRYGRPRYNDKMHNADGSSKYTIAIGGGLGILSGDSSKVFTPGYSLQAGVGYNFSKHIGVMAEFGYDHFGLQGSVIRSQTAYYNNLDIIDPSTGQFADFSGLDANAHVLSFTVDPIFTVYQGDTFGAYVIAGGGYYHKAVNFTLPQTGYYCDQYYGCYPVTQNQDFDTHTASGGGFNAGGGITFKPSRFNAVKFYAEARYVRSNAKLYPESGNPSPISTLDNSSNSYVPVTVGIRW